VVFNKQTWFVVWWHFRLRELKKLWYTEIECVIVDLKEEDERELNIRLNANSWSWDFDLLANNFEIEDLNDWWLEIPWFEVEELEAEEDDFEVDEWIKTDIVLWDLFTFHKDWKELHKLLCWDSTKVDDVEKLMNWEKADMVFTDPPYWIDYTGWRPQLMREKDYWKLLNDDLQWVDLWNLISNVFLYNKQEADVYICVSPIMQKPFLDFIENNNKKINAIIVWDKKQPWLGYMAYRRQCEFILYIKWWAFKKWDKQDFDLWSISRDNWQDYKHWTQKPVKVPARWIENSSKKDDIVLDYFLWSGSTMVAWHQLNRKVYWIEMDVKHCQNIVNRMKKLDPELEIKRNWENYKHIT
jgi:DNA modification methylase